jgi:hypothetical protein
MKLRKIKRHVKNYRPSYLVMCGDPQDRPHLVYFGTVLRQSADTMVVFAQVKVVSSFKIGILGIMGSSLSVIDPDCCQRNPRDKGYLAEKWKGGLVKSKLIKQGSVTKCTKNINVLDKHVQGFFDKVSAMSVRDGHNMLIQLTGLGVLRPNVVVMGFKDDWMEVRKRSCLSPQKSPKTPAKETDPLEEYVGIIQDTINARMGIIIVRDLQNFKWDISGKELFDFDHGIGTIDV